MTRWARGLAPGQSTYINISNYRRLTCRCEKGRAGGGVHGAWEVEAKWRARAAAAVNPKPKTRSLAPGLSFCFLFFFITLEHRVE